MFSLIIILFVIVTSSFLFKSKSTPQLKFKEKTCFDLKYNKTTIPENLKCYVNNIIIYILKEMKYNHLYVSGNEIENLNIKFNNYYQNYIVDIFIWNIKKYHYNFIKFNFVITKNNINVKSIDIINNKKNTIIKNIGNYSLFLPKKNQGINNFKLENEYLNKSIIRNKWINPN